MQNPLAFQQNYSRYDGPSEINSFFTLWEPSLMAFHWKMGPGAGQTNLDVSDNIASALNDLIDGSGVDLFIQIHHFSTRSV